MSELSDDAKRLLELAASTGTPTRERKQAVRRALLDQVSAPAPRRGLARGWLLAAALFGLGALAAATMLGHLSPPLAPSRAPSVPTQAEALVVAPPTPASAPTTTSAPPSPARPAPVPRAPRPTPVVEVVAAPLEGSALEMRKLEDGVAAMERGEYEVGLGLAREFLAAFPRSQFTTEAIALEIRTLCGLGRVGEARASVQRLSSENVKSPAVLALQDSCVAEALP